MAEVTRCRHVAAGQVQGVGFRPFVYRLARELGLTGWVQNTPEGVVIEAEGPAEAVSAFSRRLPAELPPLARLLAFSATPVPPTGEAGFHILASAPGSGHDVLISPDVATCPDCLADMADPGNRRHRYPFTNCTNCGPRYTITRRVPYDRETTSMACFPLCPDCAVEYADPADRRFHAQPNACPICGPSLWLADGTGVVLARGTAAVAALAARLAAGQIAAVKGLGGFHLVCDAGDNDAVAELRRRKGRPSKALAVMVPDLETAALLGEVGPTAAELLGGTARPICLLPARAGSALAPSVAPDVAEIGVMLPYTPLHHILLADFAAAVGSDRPAALVMTSGNAGGDPICLGNREALARLAPLADVWLLHNRDILIRTDDSVARPLETAEAEAAGAPTLFLRRARGYVPTPIRLSHSGPEVVGLGPMLKATVCLTKGDQAFVSQHIGDLENLAALRFYEETLEHLLSVLGVTPKLCVADLHPDYPSTALALEQGCWPVIRLQHHVAHIHAVLAEHRKDEPVLGLALDGVGLGEDGTLWGGECLLVDPTRLTHQRLGHFAPMALPGGDAAVRQPWRIAQACLYSLGETAEDGPVRPWMTDHGSASRLVGQMLAKNLNCPVTTSCGRLFDAVAAVTGLCLETTYEGQAAILLERAQDLTVDQPYECPLLADQTPAVLDTRTLFAQAAADAAQGVATGRIARRFHLGLVAGLTRLATAMARATGIRAVALGGGVMQNRTLALRLPEALRAAGMSPLVHRRMPANDGCVSLGQAAFGLRQLATNN
ncbi:carbamoyltransferase HypF [Solidesulfovibrio magneticus]|uniref:Carbamoyltransferase n=1 Tax=Solidesulfovibrio magneticus (strain ATCC 700980 / DSM 13731 / RS-1) TaxID=573370 RepID=C4XT05_SOLM1|nr:carbamoyltransferase HypF [Solidesulfovibrio magneticus]BAH75847.1 hydrogenase maturation protein HypF [Solidesulfovibrio magneticus RS-1]